MRLGIKFYFSWLLCAVTMFVLFYLWHGVFLNDFKRIQFPITWFVSFAAFSYLLISAGMYFLFESRLFKKFDSIFFRGLICGAVSGFCLFMVATVIHISILKYVSTNHLFLDCVWQMAEQTMGAMVLLVLKFFIHEHVPEEA
jgi:hypothetical protein